MITQTQITDRVTNEDNDKIVDGLTKFILAFSLNIHKYASYMYLL